jgi:uncharacterized membrane protein YoaK (UPF0700 family)
VRRRPASRAQPSAPNDEQRSRARRPREREQIAVALTLASVAGSVDAIGYLTLARLFTAHMSGNTARLGVDLGRGHFASALPLAGAVALFVAGIAGGTALAEVTARRRVRSVAAVVLALQALLLGGFLVYAEVAFDGHALPRRAGADFYLTSALAVLSMGVQLSVLQQVAGQTVRTTYVSGILTGFAQQAVNWLFWIRDGNTRDDRHSYLSHVLGLGGRSEARVRTLLLASVWCGYVTGAVVGSATDDHWGAWALALPLALLAAGIVVDLRRPIHLPGR